MAHWTGHGLPHFGDHAGLDLFPSERGTLVSEAALSARFRRYRDGLGLSDGLDMHSLRRSYVSHLIEAGFDPLFVQKQVGHEHASTTAIYQFVSDNYRTQTLRAALDSTIQKPWRKAGGTREARSPVPVAPRRVDGARRHAQQHGPRAAAA